MSSTPFVVLILDGTHHAQTAAESLRRAANVEVMIASRLSEALLISNTVHPQAIFIGSGFATDPAAAEQQLHEANPTAPVLPLRLQR